MTLLMNRWAPGDWTDDTDQMILLLQSILEFHGDVYPVDFAQRLKNWVQKGRSSYTKLVMI